MYRLPRKQSDFYILYRKGIRIQGIAVANDRLKRVSNGYISIDQRILPKKPLGSIFYITLSFLDDKNSVVFNILVSHERKWNRKSES